MKIMKNMSIIPKINKMLQDLYKGQKLNWKGHIESVVKYSKMLAKKTGADEEIVEIAALLHDIMKIKGQREGHHITGSEEAAKILKELGYPEDKIEKVKHCILTHSSDEKYLPMTKEAKAVASADALAHFDMFEDIAHSAYVKKGLDSEEARKFILGKYERSWKKMMPEAREIAKKRYDAIKLILEK
jgi:uncharacterized protein